MKCGTSVVDRFVTKNFSSYLNMKNTNTVRLTYDNIMSCSKLLGFTHNIYFFIDDIFVSQVRQKSRFWRAQRAPVLLHRRSVAQSS